MIEQDEGTGDNKLEELETCKENIIYFHTRQKRTTDFGFSIYLVLFFQS